MGFRTKHWVRLGAAMLAWVAVALLGSCTSSEEDVRAYQEEHCPLSVINPERLAQGDVIEIVVSGERGQVIEPVRYAYEGRDGPLRKACLTEPFLVRVMNHGTAEASGTWDTGKSEPMPILEFEHFEITRWKDE